MIWLILLQFWAQAHELCCAEYYTHQKQSLQKPGRKRSSKLDFTSNIGYGVQVFVGVSHLKDILRKDSVTEKLERLKKEPKKSNGR